LFTGVFVLFWPPGFGKTYFSSLLSQPDSAKLNVNAAKNTQSAAFKRFLSLEFIRKRKFPRKFSILFFPIPSPGSKLNYEAKKVPENQNNETAWRRQTLSVIQRLLFR
jgi:hypothetical protein